MRSAPTATPGIRPSRSSRRRRWSPRASASRRDRADLPVKSRGWEVVERIKAGELLVFDGGYGTMLFAAGLANGACPELWNDTHADVVRGIHAGYFGAGSD